MTIGYFAYCGGCGRRVEPRDLYSGLAERIAVGHFCRACLAKAGIVARPKPVAPPRKATVWLELDALHQAIAERETTTKRRAALAT